MITATPFFATVTPALRPAKPCRIRPPLHDPCGATIYGDSWTCFGLTGHRHYGQ